MARNKLIINPKPIKGEDGYRTFSIRVKDELVSRLEDVCAQSGYNRNQLISILLDYALENCEVAPK